MDYGEFAGGGKDVKSVATIAERVRGEKEGGAGTAVRDSDGALRDGAAREACWGSIFHAGMDGVRLPLPVSDVRRDQRSEKRRELPGGHAGGWMVPRNDDMGAEEKRLREEAGTAGATGDYVRRRDAGDCR